MEKKTEPEVCRLEVVSQLPLGDVGQSLGGFDFKDYPLFHQHVDSVLANFMAPEVHGDRVFSVHFKPPRS
jgi:hypothetical protein